MSPNLPAVDPLPFPGPIWLFYGLLMLLFTVHVLPMSITLGGGLYATLSGYLARTRPAYRGVVDSLASSLPIVTAATVTTGGATRLFLQVLYGNFFYSAAIVIAWPWLSVVGLVILGYYGYYLHSLKGRSASGLAHAAGAVAWVLFVIVAFIYTNQMTLMLDPVRMHALFAADPSGRSLNFGESTLWPRYLHMLVGAVALAGLWVAILGALALRRGDEASGRAGVVLGSRGFVWATLLEVVLGVWMLHTLPNRLGMMFLGGDMLATVYFGASVILTVGALVIIGRSPRAERPLGKVVVGILHIVGVVGLMVLMRDQVRRATLDAAVDFGAMHERPMTGVISLFTLLLLVGLWLVAWMVARVIVARRDASR